MINHIPQKTPSVRVSSSSSQQGRVETRSSTLGRQTHRLVFKAQKTKIVAGGQFKDKKEILTKTCLPFSELIRAQETFIEPWAEKAETQVRKS